uniref:Uncharacterized protein n=1 Tax=Anguilla anguilla TaxID=7936 RepID=A0A0E9V1T4_ANGAN
MVILLTGSPPP